MARRRKAQSAMVVTNVAASLCVEGLPGGVKIAAQAATAREAVIMGDWCARLAHLNSPGTTGFRRKDDGDVGVHAEL